MTADRFVIAKLLHLLSERGTFASDRLQPFAMRGDLFGQGLNSLELLAGDFRNVPDRGELCLQPLAFLPMRFGSQGLLGESSFALKDQLARLQPCDFFLHPLQVVAELCPTVNLASELIDFCQLLLSLGEYLADQRFSRLATDQLGSRELQLPHHVH